MMSGCSRVTAGASVVSDVEGGSVTGERVL